MAYGGTVSLPRSRKGEVGPPYEQAGPGSIPALASPHVCSPCPRSVQHPEPLTHGYALQHDGRDENSNAGVMPPCLRPDTEAAMASAGLGLPGPVSGKTTSSCLGDESSRARHEPHALCPLAAGRQGTCPPGRRLVAFSAEALVNEGLRGSGKVPYEETVFFGRAIHGFTALQDSSRRPKLRVLMETRIAGP